MRDIEPYDCGLSSIVAILSYGQKMNMNTKEKKHLLSLEERLYKFEKLFFSVVKEERGNRSTRRKPLSAE